jgi:valyl-tRNA synthetase
MVAAYPEAEDAAIDPEAERVIESVTEIIRSVRNARAEYKVENTKWIETQIYAGELKSAITLYSQTIQTLAKAMPVTFHDIQQAVSQGTPSKESDLLLVLSNAVIVKIPMGSMVNLEAEKQRLLKEIEQSQAEANRLEALLEDKAFLTRAPAVVVDKERQKLHTLTDKLERLKQKINI